jgi:hypothetical protein
MRSTLNGCSLTQYFIHVSPHAHFGGRVADGTVPRFAKQLFNGDFFVQIDSVSFRIPRRLLETPGNDNNYFKTNFPDL